MKLRVPQSGQKPTTPQGSTPTEQALPDGQKIDHWVMPSEHRALGYVRPVRTSYIHTKCGTKTTMGLAIAETYAADPKFYGSTFCCGCGGYFPVGELGDFVWACSPEEKVGS